MNELLRPPRENGPGSGGGGTIFADDEESPQLVTVSSGPYAEHLPVANMSVGEIRRRFCDRLDIDARSVAVLDGRDVHDDVVVAAGQVLTFMHRAGEKGGGGGLGLAGRTHVREGNGPETNLGETPGRRKRDASATGQAARRSAARP